MSFNLFFSVIVAVFALIMYFRYKNGPTTVINTSSIKTMEWNKEEFILNSKKTMNYIQSAREPVVIHNVPIQSTPELLNLIKSTVNQLTKTVKTSKDNEFTNFADGLEWYRTNKVSERPNYQTQSLELIPWFNCVDSNDTCHIDMSINQSNYYDDDSFNHWYVSQTIPEHFVERWLQLISNSYQQFLGHVSILNLWVTNKNTVATFHYDLADNYFLQLYGTKTMYVTKPNEYQYFRPYSSLHPNKRQSMIKNYNYTLLSSINHWNITLKSGDMLYIPATYFHSVIVLNNSISINSFHPPIIAIIYQKILKETNTPFIKTDLLIIKLKSLAKLIKNVIKHFNFINFDKFSNDFLKRIPNYENFKCLSNDFNGYCLSNIELTLKSSKFTI